MLEVHNTYNTRMQNFGRSRYKLVVSSEITTPALQRYRVCRVDLRVTNLHTVCLKFTLKFTTPTIQKDRNFRLDVRGYKLLASL